MSNRIHVCLVCQLAALLYLGACTPSSHPTEPDRLTATSHGAAGQVSGSLHVLNTSNGCWMIDCGAVIDEESLRSPTAQILPSGLETVDAVLITHAHSDHLGRLPLLIERGYRGPIYMTEPTAILARPMLNVILRTDQETMRCWVWSKQSLQRAASGGPALFIHWRNCKHRRQINSQDLDTAVCSARELSYRLQSESPRLKITVCNACVVDQTQEILRLVQTIKLNTARQLASGVCAMFLDAGHIPGSASILFEVSVNGQAHRVLFSGDLGNGLSPLLPPPAPAPEVDAVFVETTYGTVCRAATVGNQRAEFRRAVAETVAHGGVAWIPCFALDRTQKILYELRLAQREQLLPEKLPIYCSSPTAKEITTLYAEHLHSGWFAAEAAAIPDAFSPRQLHGTVPSERWLPRPCIIISTSDFLHSQWMRDLLRRLLPEPSTGIFLVGWQAPDSAGHLLLRGAKQLTIDDRQVEVKASVYSFSCFSGHADAADVDAWMSNIPKRATVVLVHGNTDELASRAEQLKQRGWQQVIIAEPDQTIIFYPPAK